MNNNLKKQVELQGMKKLDSIKGVQTLEAKDLKEIEGGGDWIRDLACSCKRLCHAFLKGLSAIGERMEPTRGINKI